MLYRMAKQSNTRHQSRLIDLALNLSLLGHIMFDRDLMSLRRRTPNDNNARPNQAMQVKQVHEMTGNVGLYGGSSLS